VGLDLAEDTALPAPDPLRVRIKGAIKAASGRALARLRGK
jgi:hypothetical protein